MSLGIRLGVAPLSNLSIVQKFNTVANIRITPLGNIRIDAAGNIRISAS